MKTLYALFTGSSPATIALLVVMAGLAWLPSFFPGTDGSFEYVAEPMPLFALLEGLFQGYRIAALAFGFLLFIITALLLDYLNTRFILVQERTYLPAWFFILITSFYPGIYGLNPVLPAALMIVLMLHLIFAAYKAEPNCFCFYEAGLALGIAALFYAPVVWLILFIWISVFIMRPFYWREWFHPLLGVFTSFLLAWGYYYIFHGDATRFYFLLIQNLEPSVIHALPGVNVLVGSAYITLIIAFASFFMLKVFQFRKVYARNYFVVLFWLFLLSLGLFIYPSGGNYGFAYIISFPVAYIATNYFVHARKSRGNRLFFGMGVVVMLLVVLNKLAGFF